MDQTDMRNMILSELIDKMHGRMADKMFPPDPDHADEPAVTAVSEPAKEEERNDIPESSDENELSDEDLAELMKAHTDKY